MKSHYDLVVTADDGIVVADDLTNERRIGSGGTPSTFWRGPDSATPGRPVGTEVKVAVGLGQSAPRSSGRRVCLHVRPNGKPKVVRALVAAASSSKVSAQAVMVAVVGATDATTVRCTVAEKSKVVAGPVHGSWQRHIEARRVRVRVLSGNGQSDRVRC